MSSRLAATVLLGVALVPLQAPLSAQTIDIELLVQADTPEATQRHWHQLFADQPGSTVRLRQGRPSDRLETTAEGEGAARHVRVRALVTSEGELVAQGVRFRIGAVDDVLAWIDRLRTGKPEPRPGENEPVRFGLTAHELEKLNELVSQPVGQSTRALGRWQALGTLRQNAPLMLTIDPGANRLAKLDAGDSPLGDELEGMAWGTALATLLRPAGLAWRPRTVDGELVAEVMIDAPRREVWPVGQSPPGSAKQIAPGWFEFGDRAVALVSVGEALAQVERETKLRVFVDHWALRQKGIDPSQTAVSLAPKHAPWVMAVRQLLKPARLQATLMADDAGEPFVWVTTTFPPPRAAASAEEEPSPPRAVPTEGDAAPRDEPSPRSPLPRATP